MRPGMQDFASLRTLNKKSIIAVCCLHIFERALFFTNYILILLAIFFSKRLN